MKNCIVNYTEKKIIITKAFAKEASIYNSEAYNTLKGLRADLPTFAIAEKTIERNPNKKTYGKLNYERMEKYIKFIEGEETETLKEFESVKEMAKFKASPYAYTKKWFLAQYPNFTNDTEQEEAQTAKTELKVA